MGEITHGTSILLSSWSICPPTLKCRCHVVDVVAIQISDATGMIAVFGDFTRWLMPVDEGLKYLVVPARRQVPRS
jgi:hypothetical protein